MWRCAGLAGDAQKAETKEEFVKVRRRDLERLTTEVMQLRDFLPKIVNGDILGTLQKLDAIESTWKLVAGMKCNQNFLALFQEKLDLRQQLNEAKQQLLQQAEYCTEMGAAVCTLLWGVSSNEEAVKTILGGSKAAKFFTITAQTMESFVKSLSEDMKQQDLDSDENQFVLALAGIVTNVAALACGREFLVSSSRELLDTMMHLLGDMKPGLCNKFKVLMLMSLYNVSINLKGLKYISESPGFIPLLWWLLNDPDTEVCLHALRLLQSVILEPEVLARTAPEMRDTLPFQRILALSKSRNADLQALAKELLEDLKIFEMIFMNITSTLVQHQLNFLETRAAECGEKEFGGFCSVYQHLSATDPCSIRINISFIYFEVNRKFQQLQKGMVKIQHRVELLRLPGKASLSWMMTFLKTLSRKSLPAALKTILESQNIGVTTASVPSMILALKIFSCGPYWSIPESLTLWGKISLFVEGEHLSLSPNSPESLWKSEKQLTEENTNVGLTQFLHLKTPNQAATCCNTVGPAQGDRVGLYILAVHSSLNYGPEAETSFSPDDSQEIPSPSAIIA
ncbi:hypothetical protein BTVI_152295 [Pitangus sulphuratus]|nr:hypothetical protein BTVI_152295 [Pitangus sulphuratus]